MAKHTAFAPIAHQIRTALEVVALVALVLALRGYYAKARMVRALIDREIERGDRARRRAVRNG